MSSIRGETPLTYRRLRRADLGVVEAVELDPDQVEHFLGPVAAIQAAVRRGPAHAMVAIEAEARPVGFYVVHPDPRDGACWWLGWFAIDSRQQGHGFGGQAMAAVMAHLQHIPGCRRIRLLVAPDNAPARRLYDRAGFHPVGRLASTGELVLEAVVPVSAALDVRGAFVFALIAAGTRRVFRHRRLRLTVGPHAAWVIGVERGPPCLATPFRVARRHHDGPVPCRRRRRGLAGRRAAAAPAADRCGLSRPVGRRVAAA